MDEFGFQWHLTDRCNLRCRHCYQDDFSPRGEPEPNELLRLLRKIFEALAGGRVRVNLTGGEPLLYPHLEQVTDALEHDPAVEEFNIITNATVLPEKRMQNLARLKKLAWFKVSVESGRPETNDFIRGDGNLEAANAGIRRIIETTGRRPGLKMTLARWNVADAGITLEFARRAGAAGVIFERFVPLGTGRRLAEQTLDSAGWLRAVEDILRLSGLDWAAADLLSYHAFWLDFTKGLRGAACNLGASMALMPDGTVYPCRRLPLALGNALTHSFSEILRSIEDLAPRRLKTRLKGDICANCSLQDCAGCRALAGALRGDWLADDPRCPLLLEPDQGPMSGPGP